MSSNKEQRVVLHDECGQYHAADGTPIGHSCTVARRSPPTSAATASVAAPSRAENPLPPQPQPVGDLDEGFFRRRVPVIRAENPLPPSPDAPIVSRTDFAALGHDRRHYAVNPHDLRRGGMAPTERRENPLPKRPAPSAHARETARKVTSLVADIDAGRLDRSEGVRRIATLVTDPAYASERAQVLRELSSDERAYRHLHELLSADARERMGLGEPMARAANPAPENGPGLGRGGRSENPAPRLSDAERDKRVKAGVRDMLAIANGRGSSAERVKGLLELNRRLGAEGIMGRVVAQVRSSDARAWDKIQKDLREHLKATINQPAAKQPAARRANPLPEVSPEGRCNLLRARYEMDPKNPLPAPSCEDLEKTDGKKVDALLERSRKRLEGHPVRAHNPLPEQSVAPERVPVPSPASAVGHSASAGKKAAPAAMQGGKNLLWRSRNIPLGNGQIQVLGMLDVGRDHPNLARMKRERTLRVSLSMIDATVAELNRGLKGKAFGDGKLAQALLTDLSTRRASYQRFATLQKADIDEQTYGVSDESKIKLTSK